jgi:hypothetical protein
LVTFLDSANGAGKQSVADYGRLNVTALDDKRGPAGTVARGVPRADEVSTGVEQITRSKRSGTSHRLEFRRPSFHVECSPELGQSLNVIGVAMSEKNRHNVEIVSFDGITGTPALSISIDLPSNKFKVSS